MLKRDREYGQLGQDAGREQIEQGLSDLTDVRAPSLFLLFMFADLL